MKLNIEEQWREFYLPYIFGELHNINSPLHPLDVKDKEPSSNNEDGYDNPLEEELYLQEHKYTTEEV